MYERVYNSVDSEYNWYISRVNEHRVMCHISLDELSLRCGIDKANLSRIFSYKSVPSVKNLIKILDALNLRIGFKYGFLYPLM